MSAPPLLVLRPDDAERLAGLFRRAGLEPAWSREAVAATLASPGGAAFGIAAPGPPDLAAGLLVRRVGPETEILAIATDPAARRAGHARALLAALAANEGRRGSARLLLEVAADNDPARALYAACGYEEDGRRPRYYRRGEGRRIDAVLMSRRLALE